MKIRFTVKMQNENLIQARKEAGLTQMELAKVVDVTPYFVSQVELLRKPPYSARQTFQAFEAISVALDYEFDYLFPPDYIEAIARDLLPRASDPLSIVKEIRVDTIAFPRSSVSQYLLESSSGERMEAVFGEEDSRELVMKYLGNMKQNEREVLMMIFGFYERPYTQAETAKRLGLTRSRVNQIKDQALSRLRHPAIRRELRGFLEDYDTLTEILE